MTVIHYPLITRTGRQGMHCYNMHNVLCLMHACNMQLVESLDKLIDAHIITYRRIVRVHAIHVWWKPSSNIHYVLYACFDMDHRQEMKQDGQTTDEPAASVLDGSHPTSTLGFLPRPANEWSECSQQQIETINFHHVANKHHSAINNK